MQARQVGYEINVLYYGIKVSMIVSSWDLASEDGKGFLAPRCLAGLSLFVASLLLLPLLTQESFALSAKDITGPCKSSYIGWRKRGGYGAFSLSTSKAYCGFSWDQINPAEARKYAVIGCQRQRKKLKCVIVAENTTPSGHTQRAIKCHGGPAQERIKECTWLIEGKRDKGQAQAWNYTERGNAYKDAGQLDKAFNDYSKAIASYKKWGWAWIDRAYVRFDQNDFEGALSDAQVSLRYYGGRVYNYRKDAERLIDKIKMELGRWKPMAEGELCSSALDASRLNWDANKRYARAIKEAQARGLTIEKCQAAIAILRKERDQEQLTAGAISERELCKAALDHDRTYWNISNAPQMVDEAKRRGFSVPICRVIENLSDQQLTFLQTKAAPLKNLELCRQSLSSTQDAWTMDQPFFFVEALRRKLSVDDCVRIAN